MFRFLFFSALRRLCELLFCCAALSFVLALLCLTGIIPDASVKMFAGVYVSLLAFYCINIGMLRDCHYDIRDDRMYLAVNFIALAVFALLNFIAYEFLPQYIYTFIFAITKFAKFTPFPLTSGYSAVIFNVVTAVVILLAPIGMKKIYEEEEAEFLEGEALRPLEVAKQETEAKPPQKTEETSKKTENTDK